MSSWRVTLSQINFKSLKGEIWWWVGFGIFLFAIGKFLDGVVFNEMKYSWHSPMLDQIIVFITERLILGIIAVFGIITAVRVWKNPNHNSKLIPAAFSLIVVGILAFVFKSFFAVPRPFQIEALNLIPLVASKSYSFPSFHTAVAFALLIPFFRISKGLGILWAVFAILVGVSRVYENVHFPSDIAGGIFLGGVVGAFFSHPDIRKTVVLFSQELEFRRQSFHFAAGFCCVFAHWAGFLRLWQIAALLVVGLAVSLVSQYHKIPIVSHVLESLDRPRDRKFPGRGAFYFLLGVFLCILIFQGPNLHIAYASILILSVGDSLNHLFGTKLHKVKFPWNKRKNLVGVGIGIASGTFAAQFFVPILSAFLASTIAISLETLPLKIGKFYLDDNIMVPLVAGGVLWGLG